MTDDRKVRPYFKAQEELENFFRKMLKEESGKKSINGQAKFDNFFSKRAKKNYRENQSD